jgi:hypothetical protein
MTWSRLEDFLCLSPTFREVNFPQSRCRQSRFHREYQLNSFSVSPTVKHMFGTREGILRSFIAAKVVL